MKTIYARSSEQSRSRADFSKFSRKVAKRLSDAKSQDLRPLTRFEMQKLGFSAGAARYVERSVRHVTARTPTISKRQFEQKRHLNEFFGIRVTLEQRARDYASGLRSAPTTAHAKNRAKALEAWELRKRYPGERVSRIREHFRIMDLKRRGEHVDYDVSLREKAFTEAHRHVPAERDFFQQWFNYGHVKTAA